ncbi:23S rRNA accumulation protein YceD [Corallincola luteus]|uniref:Large ribosomal RNA subunit accumulation protein YceD n=2 Tax=Corallincola TaxID=1775176 RepID=A0ABY1WUR0_9GAMM|nr:23S rRNA accumulation protein YceD [Corallincola spongiicola]TCI02459.1 23S rRNA accumulation protein YceD [Corallincola luteus]
MRKVKLPVRLDPIRNSQKRTSYDGEIDAVRFSRLSEMAPLLAPVSVALKCGIDAQGLAVVDASIKASLTLTCQRCNETFEQEFEVHSQFCPITAKVNVDELPDAYEPVELDENGEVELHTLVEDELMLAVPIVPMHDDADCPQSSKTMVFGEIEPADERPNPFAILNSLKK